MIESDGDAAYYLKRARQEAQLAAASVSPAAASAHHVLSINYSAKALLAHVDTVEVPLPPLARGTGQR